MEQSYLAERCKLDRRLLNEGLRPRRGKVRCLLHDIILEGNTTLNIVFSITNQLFCLMLIVDCPCSVTNT